MSRSRTIGSRLQANVHRFLLHCKIAPTSFWMQGVYIVYWFTSSLIYCSASAYQDATWYGCMPPPRRHCVTWEPSHPYQGHSSPHPIFGRCPFWKNDRPSQLLLSTGHTTLDTFLAWQHQIWPKSQKRHSGAERCLSLPELMRFQFLFESVQWSTDCCHAGLTADQRAKLRYVGKLLHGRSRAFLGDCLYKNSAVAEMGDHGHNRHTPKRGGHRPKIGCGLLCPFRRGGAGSPSNIMWPGLRSLSVPSGIFIHLAVWPL